MAVRTETTGTQISKRAMSAEPADAGSRWTEDDYILCSVGRGSLVSIVEDLSAKDSCATFVFDANVLGAWTEGDPGRSFIVNPLTTNRGDLTLGDSPAFLAIGEDLKRISLAPENTLLIDAHGSPYKAFPFVGSCQIAYHTIQYQISPNVFITDLLEGFSGSSGTSTQALRGEDAETPPRLRTENRHTHEMVSKFRRLNSEDLLSSAGTLSAIIGIINHAESRGYHPVVTLDTEEKSLEIETVVVPDTVLLVEVWGSGAADAVVSIKSQGINPLEATTVFEIVDWINATEGFVRSDRSLQQ